MIDGAAAAGRGGRSAATLGLSREDGNLSSSMGRAAIARAGAALRAHQMGLLELGLGLRCGSREAMNEGGGLGKRTDSMFINCALFYNYIHPQFSYFTPVNA